MGLLTSSDPPLTHDQAQQQRAALEQAIRTVEAESVAQRSVSNPVAQSPPPLSGRPNEVAVSLTEGRADTASTAALADGGQGAANSEDTSEPTNSLSGSNSSSPSEAQPVRTEARPRTHSP